MSDLRIAAQQALEALEDFRFAAGFDRPLAQDAIDALRSALAQQDEPEGRCEDCGMKYCECGERK